MSDNNYSLGVAVSHSHFDEGEVSLEFIVDVLRNESAFVVENLGAVVHAVLDDDFINGWYS